jgi:NAD(P)-dependent dehydrogenase (short-subunit alcohol dehydrogenase family)
MSDVEDPDLVIPPDYVANLFDLHGRVAVVTGGGSGLGRAIAIGYAQAGVIVVLADVNEAGMAETQRLIREQGHHAHAERLDVTQRAEVQALADSVVERFGRVDILVNSAGTAFRSPAEDYPEDKLDLILDLNLKGVYLCCQAFGKRMLAQGKGSIINIASIGAFIGYPWSSAYVASKHGVLGVTKVMALEWRDRGVRVNGIGPTLMDSPLTKAAATTTSLTADWIKGRMLRPRLGKPRELIGAAIYLASDASELVTGHTIMCDDGYLVA